MKFPITYLSILLWSLLGFVHIEAMTADPRPFDFTQADGSKVTLFLRGNEFLHWHEDQQGFTVIKNKENFVYAKLNEKGDLEPTAKIVGKSDPRAIGLTPKLLPPASRRSPNLNDEKAPYRPWASKKAAPAFRPDGTTQNIVAAGTVKNLVILCLFSDHTVAANGRSQVAYNTMFNKVGGQELWAPTGSVRDVYSEMSYGIVTLNSTVTAWVTLPHTQAYYGSTNSGLPFAHLGTAAAAYPTNAQGMVHDALVAVDEFVDFGQFDTDNDGYIDAITVIHSGYAAETGGAPANSIWSHKATLPTEWASADNNGNNVKVKVSNYHTEAALWGNSGTEITHIGVICHELGHFFGLPDLYDSGDSSEGVGRWCMMADSWGFDNTQLHPPHFSAWCKAFLGWVTPTILDAPGTYSVLESETNQSVYRIDRGFSPGEYLLIENRQPVGYDVNIPQGGLAIWHIDENVADNAHEGFPGQAGWPGNGNHYKVALLQADGQYDLENNRNRGDAGDLYHAAGRNSIDSVSVPNTDSYQLNRGGPTANQISNISSSQSQMTFSFLCPNSILYVDKYCPGIFQFGTFDFPYKHFTDAYNNAAQGSAIIIRGADYVEAPLNHLNKNVSIYSRIDPTKVR